MASTDLMKGRYCARHDEQRTRCQEIHCCLVKLVYECPPCSAECGRPIEHPAYLLCTKSAPKPRPGDFQWSPVALDAFERARAALDAAPVPAPEPSVHGKQAYAAADVILKIINSRPRTPDREEIASIIFTYMPQVVINGRPRFEDASGGEIVRPLPERVDVLAVVAMMEEAEREAERMEIDQQRGGGFHYRHG